MDRTALRTEIRQLINDTSVDTDRQRFSDTVLNTRIDDAQERIVQLTKCIESRITTDITAGTSEYDFPAEFLIETQVLYLNSDGDWKMLRKISETELNYYYSTWRSESGTPSHYYLRRSATKLGLYPNPDTSRTSALRIDFVRRPTALVDDTSIPFNALTRLYPFHDIICLEVAKLCSLDEKKMDPVTYFEQKLVQRLRQLMDFVSEPIEGTRIINAYELARASVRRTR